MSKKVKASPSTYDDTFRTLIDKCSRLTILMVKEVFGENYTGDEKLIPFQNEQLPLISLAGGQKIVTDSVFQIESNPNVCYHLECQTNPDGTMTIRMVEYDLQIALRNRTERTENDGKRRITTITLPKSAVLFLRNSAENPDEMAYEIKSPYGECLSVPVKVMKALEYSRSDIMQKKLYFLYPFQVFAMEDDLKNSKTEAEIEAVVRGLNQLVDEIADNEELQTIEKAYLIEAARRIAIKLAEKNKNIQERMEEAMGGRVLFGWTDEILAQGEAKGEAKGRAEGVEETTRKFVLNMSSQGMEMDQISTYLGIPYSQVQTILMDVQP